MRSNEENKQVAVVPREPVLAGDRGLQLTTLAGMKEFCRDIVNSGQFKDINAPEIALIRMQAGAELGLSPIWSLANIMVVNGRPSVWGDALLGLVLAHPACEDVIEEISGAGADTVATCTVIRTGRLPIKRTFSAREAKVAGLYSKAQSLHNVYPARMLQMRARSWALRDAFADVLRGLGVIEEVRDFREHKATAREIETPKMILPAEGGAMPSSPESVTLEPDSLPKSAETVPDVQESVTNDVEEKPAVPVPAESDAPKPTPSAVGKTEDEVREGMQPANTRPETDSRGGGSSDEVRDPNTGEFVWESEGGK